MQEYICRGTEINMAFYKVVSSAKATDDNDVDTFRKLSVHHSTGFLLDII